VVLRGVIIPKSSRWELDDVGERMVASLLLPPNESELLELDLRKVESSVEWERCR